MNLTKTLQSGFIVAHKGNESITFDYDGDRVEIVDKSGSKRVSFTTALSRLSACIKSGFALDF